MDPSFQDFEFLDLTDINDADLDHLQNVLYSPDPSVKYPELSWVEPTLDEEEGDEGAESTTDVPRTPTPQSTLNPEVPPYPPSSSHVPVTMYQMMPSVYVNNVTANVSVHHPYMSYHAVAYQQQQQQQQQQEHQSQRGGRRPNKTSKPREYRNNEEIPQQYPPYMQMHPGYNPYYPAPPGHIQSAQHATGTPIFLPSHVPMYPPPTMAYPYHPPMYSPVDGNYPDHQKDPNQYHPAEKMHNYEYQNNKEQYESESYVHQDSYNSSKEGVYQNKGASHYNSRYANNVKSVEKIVERKERQNEGPKVDKIPKVNNVIVNSTPRIESPIEMTFLNDSVISVEDISSDIRRVDVKSVLESRVKPSSAVKYVGDVIISDLKTDAQEFQPANKSVNKLVFEVKSEPIVIVKQFVPPVVTESAVIPEEIHEKKEEIVISSPVNSAPVNSAPVNSAPVEAERSVEVESEPVVEVLPTQEQGDVTNPPGSGAGKSWASLFRKNAGPAEMEPNKLVARVEPFKTQESAQDLAQLAAEAQRAQNKFDDPQLYRLGEFLCKYELDHTAVSLQPRGLTNRSNWCYINSTLQALVACPPFYNLMKSLQPYARQSHKSPTPILDSIIQFVDEFVPLASLARSNRKERGHRGKDDATVVTDMQCGAAFEPAYIYKMLNSIRSDTFKVEGRQEDAEEFLSCLLNALNDEMLEAIKLVQDGTTPADPAPVTNGNQTAGDQDDSDSEWHVMGPKNKGAVTRRSDLGRTPVSDIFRGHLRSRVQRAGDQSTDNVQPFFTLQLDIEKAQSVKEALELLVGRDQLEGVTCTKTNQQVEAWQQVTLEDLPLVLVLHLKWFDYQVDGCTKIVRTVEFPIELKVDPKLMSSTKKYGVKAKQYKLFAVVYHDGKEATKGHYVTDVFHVGYNGWVRYDDSAVRPVQEAQVLHPRAPRVPYLLYYRRGDTVGSQAPAR